MTSRLELYCADAACSIMDPSEIIKTSCSHLGLVGNHNEGSTNAVGARYSIGGLTWSLPEGRRIEDYLLCWIGAYNSAFTNVVLTFNGCEIGTNLLFIYLLFAFVCKLLRVFKLLISFIHLHRSLAQLSSQLIWWLSLYIITESNCYFICLILKYNCVL